jgi:hypothetical protein
MVSSATNRAVLLASLLLLEALQAHACERAVGYFFQVTALKGQVVGTTYPGLPRWLRQSFAKKYAKVVLYEYRWPRVGSAMPPVVKALETDGNGVFDFGTLLPGHYTLVVDGENSFDVEIKPLPEITESVTIDVSPVHPDCKGGHEFNIKSAR